MLCKALRIVQKHLFQSGGDRPRELFQYLEDQQAVRLFFSPNSSLFLSSKIKFIQQYRNFKVLLFQ